MENATIAFIGAGNMGTSLIGGLIADDVSADKIWAADPNIEKLESLQQRFGIHTHTDNETAVQHADVIVIAVKPQGMADTLKNLQTHLPQKPVLLMSVAAGININAIEKCLGPKQAIVRCMPNTPSLIRSGATAMFANPHVNPSQRDLAESIMRAVGLAVWVDDEAHLDIVTALSGSGPAYFFLFIEALSNAAQKLGLPGDTAELLALQTALGASRMALESEEHASVLREKVTSKGGTTEKALEILEAGHLRELIQEAVSGAQKRSQELAEILS